ncbi:MAG: lytic transglycosylase domain-containing protein [Acidobacteriota bacterium]
MLKNRIARTSVFALLITVMPAIGAVALASAAPGAPASSGPEVHLLDLPGVRRLFDTLERERRSGREGEQSAALAEFSLLAEAVVGDPLLVRSAIEDLQGSAVTGGPLVPASPDVRLRDRAAYQLQALGYSAREAADVVSGRISLAALDTARKMLMVGRGSEAAANYLDSQYRRVAAAREPSSAPDSGGRPPQNPIEAAIEKYASLYGVDPAIVRAIIAVESAYNVGARSRAGAIGLMQLMPATARELGVDPSIPERNIAGGVRYFSAMLEMFGGLELALVAYNGGPGFARRYALGQIPLYGETRAYVTQVLSRLPRTSR